MPLGRRFVEFVSRLDAGECLVELGHIGGGPLALNSAGEWGLVRTWVLKASSFCDCLRICAKLKKNL
jgi:hypothetical protein